MTGAAAAAGVTRQTVSGWRAHCRPFRAALDDARADAYAEARDRLAALMIDAVDVLADTLALPPDGGVAGALRLRAALAVLARLDREPDPPPLVFDLFDLRRQTGAPLTPARVPAPPPTQAETEAVAAFMAGNATTEQYMELARTARVRQQGAPAAEAPAEQPTAAEWAAEDAAATAALIAADVTGFDAAERARRAPPPASPDRGSWDGTPLGPPPVPAHNGAPPRTPPRPPAI